MLALFRTEYLAANHDKNSNHVLGERTLSHGNWLPNWRKRGWESAQLGRAIRVFGGSAWTKGLTGEVVIANQVSKRIGVTA